MINAVDISKAVALLRAGQLVAFPTETVYGLGADARNELAISQVFTVKHRPRAHPLIVHLASSDQLQHWAMDMSPGVLTLAHTFWPGPLTMVLKKQSHVLDIVTGGQDTVALRVPSHPIALALLQAFGDGIVAPSANQFTHISPTTSAAVQEELGDAVSMILDGGACSVGVESTIVDMTGDVPIILRPGMISAKAIETVLGCMVITSPVERPIRAPGMHALHYAPVTKTILMAKSAIPDFLHTLHASDLPLALMMYSKDCILPIMKDVHLIQMPNSAQQYAHDLYHTLRMLDHQQFKQMVIEAVPESSDWVAIHDRLFKATAER